MSFFTFLRYPLGERLITSFCVGVLLVLRFVDDKDRSSAQNELFSFFLR